MSRSDDASNRAAIALYTADMAKPDRSPPSSPFSMYGGRCFPVREDRQTSFMPPLRQDVVMGSTKQGPSLWSCPSSPRSVNSDVYNTSQSSQSWQSFDTASQEIAARDGPPTPPPPSARVGGLVDGGALEPTLDSMVDKLSSLDTDDGQDLDIRGPREKLPRAAAQLSPDTPV